MVDQSFDLKTSDPGRAFELTGSIVDRALYETLLTFKGSDVTKPVPQLATYKESSDNKTLTLTLDGKHKFSDGTTVTADDVVFSLKRVQGIKGNPSFLLDGVTVNKVDDKTVTLTTATPNPALPFILPEPVARNPELEARQEERRRPKTTPTRRRRSSTRPRPAPARTSSSRTTSTPRSSSS